MLGQADVAKYFDQCGSDPVAIEEVLHAYIIAKFMKGATAARVMNKLHHLYLYLRATERLRILSVGNRVFNAATLEVAAGGTNIGISPVCTGPGKCIWNVIRRNSRSQIITDGTHGAPSMISRLLTSDQSTIIEIPETRLTRFRSSVVVRLPGDSAGPVLRPREVDDEGIQVPAYDDPGGDVVLEVGDESPGLPEYEDAPGYEEVGSVGPLL